MVEVARRDAATFIPIIQQYIHPGSIIYSDQWAAYNQITAATGMAHMTVNHSLNFVDQQQVSTHREWNQCGVVVSAS